MKFGVLGILCRIFIAYSIANHFDVNFSISSIWIQEESSNFSVILISISRNYVVSDRRGFVLGFYFGPQSTDFGYLIELLLFETVRTSASYNRNGIHCTRGYVVIFSHV